MVAFSGLWAQPGPMLPCTAQVGLVTDRHHQSAYPFLVVRPKLDSEHVHVLQ